MAAMPQETEIVLAQRLASNERSVRNKALKTLRKYISLRSQKIEGGFTSDDLMKIWKGLFYCLWMQDKPLLQEELSDRITGLIHSFHTFDNQLLYFETFLQTVKREWNGIDGLRMDKFFQLVRFVFRQAFEILKRNKWESSVVNRFLEVFTAQLLQKTERVPYGLILHVLDLYMTELARVGASQLTAEQNLTFIDPFCRTMAKTKDSKLLNFLSKNIFTVIVDQAPFAVEDLIKELRHAGENSDPDQLSEAEECVKEDEPKVKVWKKTKGTVNGIPEHEEDGQDNEEDLMNMDDPPKDKRSDNAIGTVLQFDYGAIADRLFELGIRQNMPNLNRAKMYKLLKIYRDLSEGRFPQEGNVFKGVGDGGDYDEDAGEGKKKKKKKKNSKKKRKNQTPLDEEKSPAKKCKVTDCEEVQEPSESDQDGGAPGRTTEQINKKKKKKGKVKLQTETSLTSVEPLLKAGDTPVEQKNEQQSEEQSVDVSRVITETNVSSVILETENMDSQESGSQSKSEAGSRKKKRKNKKISDLMKVEEEAGIQLILKDEVRKCPSIETLEEVDNGAQQAKVPTRSRKRKGKQNQGEEPSPNGTSANIPPLENLSSPTPAKKKKKQKGAPAEEGSNTTETDSDVKVFEDGSKQQPKCAALKKKKKLNVKPVKNEIDEPPQEGGANDEMMGRGDVSTIKKNKKKQKEKADKTSSLADSAELSQLKSVKKRKRASPQEKVPEGQLEVEPDCITVELSCTPTPLNKKKNQKKQKLQMGDITVEISEENGLAEAIEEPVLKKSEKKQNAKAETSSVTLKKGKKKRSMQTQEAEISLIKGHAADEDPEISIPVSAKKKLRVKKVSSESDFVSFQGQAKAPSPLFYKVKSKSSPSTPLSSNKTFQTPKSETKKVTFGLKNNKTAEFRKTDQSLLVSPVGSSRVAFDPKKKPVSSVLKPPLSSPAFSVKKSTPKRRATAADFF